MINKARENAGCSGVADDISFIVATAAALPFPDNSFDLVISYASLHHWFQPVAVFNEIARVTGETSRIIIRDNKRVYQNPLGKAFIWLVTRFMNKRHRENWPRALLASYTVPEVREILSRSDLNNYRVTSDFVFIDLCIEGAGNTHGNTH
jgi:ubiquinone/menaquinone biosynthesis C-methylase UbiE